MNCKCEHLVPPVKEQEDMARRKQLRRSQSQMTSSPSPSLSPSPSASPSQSVIRPASACSPEHQPAAARTPLKRSMTEAGKHLSSPSVPPDSARKADASAKVSPVAATVSSPIARAETCDTSAADATASSGPQNALVCSHVVSQDESAAASASPAGVCQAGDAAASPTIAKLKITAAANAPLQKQSAAKCVVSAATKAQTISTMPETAVVPGLWLQSNIPPPVPTSQVPDAIETLQGQQQSSAVSSPAGVVSPAEPHPRTAFVKPGNHQSAV